jgi:hypothetical protein
MRQPKVVRHTGRNRKELKAQQIKINNERIKIVDAYYSILMSAYE